MKRKLFTLILAIVYSAGIIHASDIEINGIWYTFNKNDLTASVTYCGSYAREYNEYYGSVVIPSTVSYSGENYTVAHIGLGAFEGCSSLISITIPNSVTSIDRGAFKDCSSLTSITIPDNVTSIGSQAFWGCNNLKSIAVNNNNTTYDSRINCNAIIESATNTLIVGCTKTIIPNSVTSIGEVAFYGCTGLTSIEIPNSVTSIGNGAFCGCSSLTSIEIPNSVTSIGEGAFENCTGLKSVTIHNGVTSIEGSAFSGCTNLTFIEIPNSVTSIGEGAFYDCSGLTSVIIGNSVTSIGDGAFWNCSNLNSVNIPNSVTSIGTNVFMFCRSLTSIEIPNSVTSMGDYAFHGCTSLSSIEIPNSVKSIGMFAFAACTGLKSVTIHNGVTSIGEGAFLRCRSLTSIEIPNSVTSIGEGAFENCADLKSIAVDNNNATYDSRLNCNAIVESATNTLIIGCMNTIIPNSVTSIGNSAFYNCTTLTLITIPNSVTSIGEYAFCGCSSLTSIEIPNSVTSIKKEAFANCTGLKSVTCMAMTPPTLDNNTWHYVDCSNVTLYVPAKSIDTYRRKSEWDSFHPILPISAKDAETETTTVQTTATEFSVDVTWPFVEGANSYELVIKDKEGKIVCTLIFNAQGQLTSIAYSAPSRNGAPQNTQTAGFSFTITGLEPGTEYDLIITAKDAYGREIDKKNVTFHTNWPNGVEDIHVNSAKPLKVLMDGQIYILRSKHIFDTQGKMVR